MTAPTEKQHELLLMLGSGSAALSMGKRRIDPLLKRGWVTAKWVAPFYQWVRITPDGLRALAASVEKYGLPDLAAEKRVKVCCGCGREWKPVCRCGDRAYRFEMREVEAA